VLSAYISFFYNFAYFSGSNLGHGAFIIAFTELMQRIFTFLQLAVAVQMTGLLLIANMPE